MVERKGPASVSAPIRVRILEYAERAGSRTAFWWGDEVRPCACTLISTIVAADRPRVGAYRPNAFGLDDMAGNTFEWVEDCWHESYQGAPDDRTPWTDTGCSVRAMRGTPWLMIDPTPLRSSYRNCSNSSNRSEVIGFLEIFDQGRTPRSRWPRTDNKALAMLPSSKSSLNLQFCNLGHVGISSQTLKNHWDVNCLRTTAYS
jgi:Sulfatase-modifying factor enzyme 1